MLVKEQEVRMSLTSVFLISYSELLCYLSRNMSVPLSRSPFCEMQAAQRGTRVEASVPVQRHWSSALSSSVEYVY